MSSYHHQHLHTVICVHWCKIMFCCTLCALCVVHRCWRLYGYLHHSRQLVTIMENKSHMKVTCAAAARASCNAMRFPRQFDRPCLLTAMAAAMNPLLVPVVRTPLAPTIAACLGDEKSKLKVYKMFVHRHTAQM